LWELRALDANAGSGGLRAAHGKDSSMKTSVPRARIAARIAVLLAIGIAIGFAPTSTATEEEVREFADEGFEDDCLACHDESAKKPILPILATQHAVKADERTPLARPHECQTCHGPSAAHMEDDSTPVSVVFGLNAAPGPQNEVCLGCHQGGDRINWQASTHAASNDACASCHSIHAMEDPVMLKNRRPDTPINRPDQTAVCFQCHADKRAEINKASSHPVRDGLIACSDCHNPHGSMGPTSLQRPTVNETCFTCHAEKRGSMRLRLRTARPATRRTARITRRC
jgi:DmsE family decaheme c-type cytochrome